MSKHWVWLQRMFWNEICQRENYIFATHICRAKIIYNTKYFSGNEDHKIFRFLQVFLFQNIVFICSSLHALLSYCMECLQIRGCEILSRFQLCFSDWSFELSLSGISFFPFLLVISGFLGSQEYLIVVIRFTTSTSILRCGAIIFPSTFDKVFDSGFVLLSYHTCSVLFYERFEKIHRLHHHCHLLDLAPSFIF